MKRTPSGTRLTLERILREGGLSRRAARAFVAEVLADLDLYIAGWVSTLVFVLRDASSRTRVVRYKKGRP